MTHQGDIPALEAGGLGKRYRRGWGLRDCTFSLPKGRVSALVGPNGAGKSTLMSLATGLLRPTSGHIRVLGAEPARTGSPRGLAFLAQDKPLYRRLTVAEMLRAGRKLNPTWDDVYATRLVEDAGVPLSARIGTLSGGQRTRVALAVALGRRPQLVMLDEPLADLDPLARQEVMQTLMAEVAESGMTVLMSSHIISDLEGVCDHLLLIDGGRVRLAGDTDSLLAEHRLVTGSRDGDTPFPERAIVEKRETGRQVTLLVKGTGPTDPDRWVVGEPGLDELVLAYLRSSRAESSSSDAKKAVAA